MLNGKRILIFGVANKNSIAWGVAQKASSLGAKIGLCYFSESNRKRVLPLAQQIGADFCEQVDVTSSTELLSLKEKIKPMWEQLDGLVHSVAFAPPQDLNGNFSDVSEEGFFKTLNISAYSLLRITNNLKEIFAPSSSVLAMTYYGSQKVLPGYGVMGVAKSALESIARYLADELGSKGIRVNCISPGPIKTLAAFGISDFDTMLSEIEKKAPLKRNISTNDVGDLSSFLLSDSSKFITGQTIFLDSGISIKSRF